MARQSADERRRHVLEAAIATFAAEGYHGASTTDIARAAGISQPYIYALYRNKHDLFLAAYHEVAAGSARACSPPPRAAPMPRSACARWARRTSA